ncbi:MAG: rhodanese-like domain-containing protein [Sphaerospermopsis sp. SIO1G2]|nr:rhodanese-like domain-containing protein [Sphaerospermopsis sp. SIO1G1]NET70620.1 rhodanese-like domain-containing protein [Sphaerospermopsis sp. SIO1G2]
MMNNLRTEVNDLLLRLEWGQPAFTIIDIRDRLTFNHGHITGAIPICLDDLLERAKFSLHPNRDIVIYGDSETDVATAINLLVYAGFKNVSELVGGLSAWKAMGGATEGV